jgi:PAS domain S-box-containing protein
MSEEKTVVLLIEDNPGDARLIREYLLDAGSGIFELEHVDRLASGLERIARGDIGVILLDLTLPDSQGLDGLRKVLTQSPKLPVVVLSGIKDEATAISAVHTGAQDYLVKGSIDASLLTRSLRHAIERQRLRVALQESESRYRLLADNISDVVWVADEKGEIAYVSPSVQRLLGYTVDEMMKLRIRDLLTPDSAEQARRLIKSQMEIGARQSKYADLSLTLEHIRKDGSTVWAEVKLSFLLDKKGNFSGIMGASRDVTARRKAEEALRRSEEYFRALIENASDAIVIINGDGTMRYESPSIERMLGYRFEERAGRSAFENIHPDHRQNVIDIFTQLLQEPGGVRQTEILLRDKNGAWHTVEAIGKNLLDNPSVGGVVANLRDITERRKAEEARRESEARFRTIFEGTSVAIALVDRRGTPLSINPAFRQMFGYSFEEFCSLNKMKYLYPDDALVDAGLFQELINGKRDHYTVDKRFVRKGGEVLWGRQNLSVVRDAEGKPEYFIAMIEDITERKKMEEELLLLSDAVRMSTDSIVLTDLEGRLVEANEAALKIQGVKSKEELIGFKPSDYIVPEDQEKAFADLAALMEKGCVNHVQYHVMTRDGRKVLLETSASIMKDKNGVPKGIVAVSRDITERKRMEEALKESEERHRLYFESVSDVIYSLDRKFRFENISPSVERILGYKPEEFLGRRFDELNVLVPETIDRAFEDVRRVLAGERILTYGKFVRKDGEIVYGEVSLTPIFAPDGSVKSVLGVARDITVRKKMEEEIRLLSDAVKMSTESIFIADLDGRIIDANEAALKMLGTTNKPDVIGKGVTELIVPEDRQKAFDNMKRVLQEGLVKPVEYHLMRNDGSTILTEISASALKAKSGNPKGFVAVARDITERRRMEKALKESESNYRLLFDSTIDGLFVIDAETMKVVLANKQVATLFGFSSAEETIGLEPLDFVHPDDRERVLRAIVEDMFEKDLREVNEFRVKTKQGKDFWISAVGTRIEYRGRTAGLVSVRDITDRKRAEETARETEERFQRLVSNAQDIVFRWSVTKGLEYVSPIVSEITGYTAEELFADPIVGLKLAWEGDPGLAQDYRKVMKEGASLRSREISFVRKDGKKIYLDMRSHAVRDVNGRVIAFEGILRDISDRKKMESELQQNEQNYLLLLESTHEAMIVVDAETLKVLFGNRRASKMFGFDPELRDGIGVNMLDFVYPEERGSIVTGFVEDLPRLDRRKRYEVRARTRDGREIWVSALATRIEYQGRLAVLLAMEDITERRKAVEEKQKMEEQLRLAGRLAAVGELAAGVAHELNNPLAAIQGFAQLLVSKEDLDQSLKKDLSVIHREAQRAAKITKNLLSFARRHEPEMRFISINEPLEKTLELRAHQLKMNNIELVTQLDPHLPKTMADFHQMQQIFLNIINNAEQAMVDAHGKGRLIIRSSKHGNIIQVEFIDDGPGISEENLPRIFDPFFTTKEVGKGTGLGLSICYGLIEAHHGHIYARSKLGEGATFIVELPIVPEEPTGTNEVHIKTGSKGARWKK